MKYLIQTFLFRIEHKTSKMAEQIDLYRICTHLIHGEMCEQCYQASELRKKVVEITETICSTLKDQGSIEIEDLLHILEGHSLIHHEIFNRIAHFLSSDSLIIRFHVYGIDDWCDNHLTALAPAISKFPGHIYLKYYQSMPNLPSNKRAMLPYFYSFRDRFNQLSLELDAHSITVIKADPYRKTHAYGKSVRPNQYFAGLWYTYNLTNWLFRLGQDDIDGSPRLEFFR